MGHNSQAPKSRVIAVIGMHRSGTSLATRALHALGVALGDNLAVEPAPDNAKGHWEDRDVIELNKQVLSALALQWDLVGANDEALMGAAGLTPLVERGQALLQAKTAKHPIWAFKDPRTARLWPFWRRVLLEENHFHTSFVWAIRHPWAVAQSLARRDGFGSLKSHLLWLNHNLNPFEDITANQHVLLDYDRLLSQPRREITRIGEALALEPADGSAVDAFINDFLDTGLKHFDQPGAESLRTGAERVADRAYSALRNLAENEEFQKDRAFLAEWRDIHQEAVMFAAISPLVDASSISETSRRELEGQLAQLAESSATDLNSLREQVAETLREQFDENGRRIDQVREDAAAGLDGLQRQVAETLREQFDESGRRIDQVREDAAAGLQRQVAETLREHLDESGRRIDQVREDAAAGLDGLQRQVAETLREQFDESGRRIDQVREDAAAGLDGLQRQVAETLREHLDESGRRIDQVREDAAAGLDGLQRQVAETLREHLDESGRRIDQVREDAAAGLDGLQRQVAETLREHLDESGRRIDQVREDAAAGLDGLQRQVAETLREQFDESGRRIDQVREDAAAGLDGLQRQVAETLREQFEVTGQRIDETREHLLRVEADMAVVIEQLDRERYTVFKPLLRRAYRLGAAVAMRLPGPVRRLLQRLKRRLLPRSVASRVTVGHPPTATESDAEPMPDFGQPSVQHHDILVCPVIDWHFRFQRPQHLAKLLAERGHRVFYLSTTFGNAAVPGFRVLESPAPNVFLVQLCIPGRQPVIYEDLLPDSTRRRMVAAVDQLTAAGGLSNLVALVNLPFWRPLAEALPGALVVYDCMDHHAGFSSNSPAMLQEEERLLKSADLVITTSARLSGIVGQSAANVLIRNAAEIERFSKVPERLAYPSERSVAGYLGAIADWFDMDLVIAAAERFQDWDFVLVGDTAFCDLSKAKKISNIKLIGEVPYAEAANWVHSFNVALIPFQLTELTLCTSPVKVYEYLAAGKPVVATALPELQLMGDWVQVAENADQFTQHLGTAMMESDDRQRAAQRAEWVRQHDWKARVDQLEKAIETAFPKVSVIVLTYNNLSFTQACLHSLEANTHYPDWELVLVDNGSTDGTKDFLGGYAANNPRAKLVQNDENLGFAAGNNRGLEAADGEMLVILNNDTYVTPGWLLDLTRHLRRDPQLGLVGPVTNNIGNEAKIDIQYADMQEMQNAARAYTSSRAGERLDLPVIAFFCAAMPRTVYETVGGLEERFGLGFFEDDDYCQRVRKAGFQVAVAEDVFIHHHLSASFEQMDEGSRQALFERNKAIYEEKWGPWKPHQYRE